MLLYSAPPCEVTKSALSPKTCSIQLWLQYRRKILTNKFLPPSQSVLAICCIKSMFRSPKMHRSLTEATFLSKLFERFNISLDTCTLAVSRDVLPRGALNPYWHYLTVHYTATPPPLVRICICDPIA